MLVGLFIKNIAVIEEASIDFLKGFTALTGETGAGKSIIVDAFSVILGARASKDLIRTGCEKASVTALFTDVSNKVKHKLAELNIQIDADDDLQIYREIRINGKSLCKVNGVPLTASMLKEIGVMLISVHGQHDSYELLSPEIHGTYIDNYAGLNPLLKQYQEQYDKLKQIKIQLDSLLSNQNEKERRMDLLKFQIEEIESAEIKVGERESLIRNSQIIKNRQNILEAVNFSKEMIDGSSENEGILTMAELAAKKLEQVSDSDEVLTALVEKIRDTEYALQDISQELRKYESMEDFDPSALPEIEERLDLLYKLSLKYGESEEDIISLLETLTTELNDTELSEEKIELLSQEFEDTKVKAIDLAKKLSNKRKEASLDFSEKVKSELRFLNMPNIEFISKLERTNLYSWGCDKLNFMVSVNQGEELKPLSKVASGGELSRIMLAIKTVLSNADDIDTLIFDEVDAGISGKTASKVGEKLRQASEDRQIICITHLAQIACVSNNHLLIEKTTEVGKTYTKVLPLNREERIHELARIIGGSKTGSVSYKMAEEMLN